MLCNLTKERSEKLYPMSHVHFSSFVRNVFLGWNVNVLVLPTFFCRLKEVSEKINRYGFVTPAAFTGLKTNIKRIVVGPSHIALLTEDNRVCRVAFTVLYDRLDLRKNEPNRRYDKKLNKSLKSSAKIAKYFDLK